MAGAEGRPTGAGRARPAGGRSARAVLVGATLAGCAPGGCAADRQRREAVCQTLFETLAEHDDLTLALLCRARLPTDVCREVQTSLGARPWTPERMGATCHTWSASARLRQLQPGGSFDPPEPGSLQPGGGSGPPGPRSPSSDTTDEVLTGKSATNRETILDAGDTSGDVEGVIRAKTGKALDNITTIDRSVCEKSGLQFVPSSAPAPTSSSGTFTGSSADIGECVRPTRPPTRAPTPAPPPTPAPTLAPATTQATTTAWDVGTETTEAAAIEAETTGAAAEEVPAARSKATTAKTTTAPLPGEPSDSSATSSGNGTNATGSSPSDADIGFAEMLKSASDAEANVSEGAGNITLGAAAENATTNGTADAGLTTNLTSITNASANVSAAANVTPETAAQNFSNGTVGARAANVTSGALAKNGTTNGTADAGLTTNLTSITNASANVSAAANVTPETAAQNFSNGTVGVSSLGSAIDEAVDDTRLSDLRNGTLPAADAGGVVALAAVAGAGAPAAARQLLAVAAAGAAGVVVLVLSVSAVRWGAAQGRAYDSRLMQYISLSQESDGEEDGGAAWRQILLPDLEGHRTGAACRDGREWLPLE